MNGPRCDNEECTAPQTGKCVLNFQLDECSNWIPGEEETPGADNSQLFGDSVLPNPEDVPRFPPSAALGMDELRALMAKEYCSLIGLLGTPNSGKTALLVSLYLLLAQNRLNGFTFADSKSLMALDELSRGARLWCSEMPEQMTAHTELGDVRSAGFLHFKVLRTSDCSPVHLLIPDLPGEWSTSLVENNRTDRLSFLQAADLIWVMVDGKTLTSKDQRLGAIHRTCLLIDRLAEFLLPEVPPVYLVVSRRDIVKPTEETLQELGNRAARHGINLSVCNIASFSENEEITPGDGIGDLIAQAVKVPTTGCDFWPKPRGTEITS